MLIVLGVRMRNVRAGSWTRLCQRMRIPASEFGLLWVAEVCGDRAAVTVQCAHARMMGRVMGLVWDRRCSEAWKTEHRRSYGGDT